MNRSYFLKNDNTAGVNDEKNNLRIIPNANQKLEEILMTENNKDSLKNKIGVIDLKIREVNQRHYNKIVACALFFGVLIPMLVLIFPLALGVLQVSNFLLLFGSLFIGSTFSLIEGQKYKTKSNELKLTRQVYTNTLMEEKNKLITLKEEAKTCKVYDNITIGTKEVPMDNEFKNKLEKLESALDLYLALKKRSLNRKVIGCLDENSKKTLTQIIDTNTKLDNSEFVKYLRYL